MQVHEVRRTGHCESALYDKAIGGKYIQIHHALEVGGRERQLLYLLVDCESDIDKVQKVKRREGNFFLAQSGCTILPI